MREISEWNTRYTVTGHPFVIGFRKEVCSRFLSSYDRPRALRCFFVFLRPILDALLVTVPSDRPNLSATFAVELFGKSFLSKAISLFDHKPLISFFFAITWFLSLNCTYIFCLFCCILSSDIVFFNDFLFSCKVVIRARGHRRWRISLIHPISYCINTSNSSSVSPDKSI